MRAHLLYPAQESQKGVKKLGRYKKLRKLAVSWEGVELPTFRLGKYDHFKLTRPLTFPIRTNGPPIKKTNSICKV
jgi:hypothetical protein